MKAIFGLVLFSMIAVSFAAQCQMNPYLAARMKYSGTPLVSMTDVQTSGYSKVCIPEFKAYGFCCNEWSLTPHVSEDNRYLTTATEKLVSSYVVFDGYVNKLSTILKSLALLPQSTYDPMINNAIAGAKTFLDNPINLDYLDTFKNFASDGPSFVASTRACWKKMAEFRQSTICQVCSGRSHVFFRNGKGMVEDTFCKELLDSCWNSLKSTLDMIKLFNWLVPVQPDLARFGVRIGSEAFVIPQKFEVVENLYEGLKIDNLATLVTKTVDTSDIKKDVEICQRFLNLANKPYIIDFTDAISVSSENAQIRIDYVLSYAISSNSNIIRANLQAFESNLASRLSAWRQTQTESRQLVLTSPTVTDPFQSDVQFVKNSDNMFDSYVGTQGSTIFDSNASGQPFNLYMGFP